MTNKIRIAKQRTPADQTTRPAKQGASLKLFSISDAAQYAGVSGTTVRRWIKAGQLKVYRAGRQIRIDEGDLIEFLSPESLRWL